MHDVVQYILYGDIFRNVRRVAGVYRFVRYKRKVFCFMYLNDVEISY